MKTKKLATESKVIFESKINWFGVGRIIGVFIMAFVASFFITKTVYYLAKKQPIIRTNKVRKISLQGNEELLYLDPVLLKTYIDQAEKNYVLIDIRSSTEYKSGHIVGAKNVPLYTNYQRVYESLVKKDSWLKQAWPIIINKKTVIVYGYSTVSDLLLVTVNDLKKAGWPIKILGVDWNDWQNNFYQWMPGAAYGGIDSSRYVERDITGAPPMPAAPPVNP